MNSLLTSILRRGRALDQPSIDLLVRNHADTFAHVFTHKSIHPTLNYEHYEFVGDSVVNSCVIRYLYDKYPQLHSADGTQVLTRMKITIICREFLARMATDLGMDKFIDCDEYHRTNHMKSICEDVFEAFFGATSILVDRHILDGAGAGVIKHILYDILDQYPIRPSYETLVDSTTRLKELCDATKIQLDAKYERDDETKLFTCFIIYRGATIGTGRSYKKKQAYASAAETAIRTLRQRYGVFKDAPPIYETLK